MEEAGLSRSRSSPDLKEQSKMTVRLTAEERQKPDPELKSGSSKRPTTKKQSPAPSLPSKPKTSQGISPDPRDKVEESASTGIRVVESLKGNITKEQKEELVKIYLNIMKEARKMKNSIADLKEELSMTKLKAAEELLKKEEEHTKTLREEKPVQSPQESYATRAKRNLPEAIHKILVSSTKEATAEDIAKEIRANIKPQDLKIGVSSFRIGKESVIIGCPKADDADALIARVNTHSNGTLAAKAAQRRNPIVILKGVGKEYDDNEIPELLIQQNEAVANTSTSKMEIKIVRVLKNKNDKLKNCMLQVTPAIRTAMLDSERVNLGFMRVHVEDVSPLLQCYKCQGFGHTSLKCTEKTERCVKCAKAHSTKDCTATEDKCWNCCKAKKSSINHRANSKTCPFLVMMEARALERINYGQ
jgi:hypothetical protein